MEENSDDNNLNERNDLYSLEELVKKGYINQKTCDKIKLGRSIIEKKYFNKEKQYIINEKIYNTINNYFNNITFLADSDKEEIKKSIFQLITNSKRLSRQKMEENRFEIISEIGHGGFGKVKLCKDITTNQLYAMKKLKFDLLINKAQLFHINTEKNILSLNDNPWKVKLNYSFLYNGYLYFIMDYYPGGDLYKYIEKKDTLTEEEAKFYIAEIILGVESLHKNNCIHRDIKPDNIFIDQEGHLKIGDFGLSILSNNIAYPYTYKYIKKQNKENIDNLIGLSDVGSLLYVAPEVIEKKMYGPEIDWWSVGIIFYEMLVGFPPFWSKNDNDKTISMKLKNFKKYLNIPKEVKISNKAQKLIFDFLSESDKRLGKNGIDEIKNHIFFKNFDWENIRKMKPPFIPKLFIYEKDKFNFRLIRKNSLQFYTSKEKLKNNKNIFEIKQEKEKENKLKKINLNFYDFDYNRELEKLKYDIENNITELIKKEIDNYSKLNTIKSGNITLEETSTEEIASLQSNESNKKKNENLSKSHFNTDIKNKINNLLGFNKINNYIKSSKSKILKRKSIKIIPIRNLMNNQSLVNKTMYNSKFKDKSVINKSIRKNSNMDIDYKKKDSNKSLKSVEKLQKNVTFQPKDKIINYKLNNINCNRVGNKNNNNNNNDDKKKIKINGKLFMLKKNLGKYLLEQ